MTDIFPSGCKAAQGEKRHLAKPPGSFPSSWIPTERDGRLHVVCPLLLSFQITRLKELYFTVISHQLMSMGQVSDLRRISHFSTMRVPRAHKCDHLGLFAGLFKLHCWTIVLESRARR